jgi:hypothetical protein
VREAMILLHRRRWLLGVIGVCLASCGRYITREEFEEWKRQQQEQQAGHNAEHRALRGMIDREGMQREVEVRQVASRAACDNEKLRDFLKECEEGTDVCSDKGVLNAWKFITTQPGAEMFLRPHAGAKGIIQIRRGQLISLCDAKNMLPSSRFLILVKPRSDSEDHHEEAMHAGREVRNYLLQDLLSKRNDVRILGPRTLPCKMKTEELSNYTGLPLPYPLRGEPQGREPTVIVWVFRTDC